MTGFPRLTRGVDVIIAAGKNKLLTMFSIVHFRLRRAGDLARWVPALANVKVAVLNETIHRCQSADEQNLASFDIACSNWSMLQCSPTTTCQMMFGTFVLGSNFRFASGASRVTP